MPDFVLVLIVVLILALLWRGPKTLPKLGQSFGRGVKSVRDDVRASLDDPDGSGPDKAA